MKNETTYDTLATRWDWKPMRNCPGRYSLAGAPSDLTVEALVGPYARISRFSVETAPDIVVVVPLDRGGLISYKRADGTYLHTLGDPEGFARKLAQLGIAPP
jgi:hypothetical protein